MVAEVSGFFVAEPARISYAISDELNRERMLAPYDSMDK
jgi:hypothetical protein